ncbi:MAG: terminase, partial [Proteobacteria bacterium]|nr:terminase [Pseudomonadota bacterium]
MDRVGRQSPTVSVILPYTDTKGAEAIALYNKSEKDALPWQEALTYDIMAVDDDGLWVHQKFGYSVPRRNGKSEMALA